MSQGRRSVAKHALKFLTIAIGSGWGKSTLKAAYCQGLNPEILREMACHVVKLTLDSLIDLTIPLVICYETSKTPK